jgi:hypothetical protein
LQLPPHKRAHLLRAARGTSLYLPAAAVAARVQRAEAKRAPVSLQRALPRRLPESTGQLLSLAM